jgi:hypothetical protein
MSPAAVEQMVTEATRSGRCVDVAAIAAQRRRTERDVARALNLT